MSEIDIRIDQDKDIDSIRICDEADAYLMCELVCIKDSKCFVYDSEYFDDRLWIENKQHAENVIKAIQKAIELANCREPAYEIKTFISKGDKETDILFTWK